MAVAGSRGLLHRQNMITLKLYQCHQARESRGSHVARVELMIPIFFMELTVITYAMYKYNNKQLNMFHIR